MVSKKSKLKITLKRSPIGTDDYQRQVLRGLGLRKLGLSVIRENRPEVRGMCKKVIHLLAIEEITERSGGSSRAKRSLPSGGQGGVEESP